jgi:hypothetical protein
MHLRIKKSIPFVLLIGILTLLTYAQVTSIDYERVGVYGHSSGGYGSIRAIIHNLKKITSNSNLRMMFLIYRKLQERRHR